MPFEQANDEGEMSVQMEDFQTSWCQRLYPNQGSCLQMRSWIGYTVWGRGIFCRALKLPDSHPGLFPPAGTQFLEKQHCSHPRGMKSKKPWE